MSWDRPHHLSDAEGRSARTRRHRAPRDWFCEFELDDATAGSVILDDPVCAGWLLDLRALGMRPEVAVLEATEPVTPWAGHAEATVTSDA
jgi:hypothetical protein